MLINAAILDRVIDSRKGNFTPELARQILKFTFPAKDRARYQALAYKVQSGKLTARERTQLDDYLNVNDLLAILKAKAAASLKKAGEL